MTPNNALEQSGENRGPRLAAARSPWPPAQREAAEIFEQREDKVGLGDAYATYGFFFRSLSVEHWQHIYRSGFLDKDATFDGRYERSIVYFERAADLFRATGRFDRLTNVEFNMGVTYALMHKDKEACAAYDASTGSEHRAMDTNASYRPVLPSGFDSWEAFIGDAKRRLDCAS